MACPQLENGHVRVANDYFDRLIQADLSLRGLKVLLAVLRLTWGYRRKTHRLSFSHLARLTGVHRSRVSETVADLVERRFLLQTEEGELGPQKDFDLWAPAMNRRMRQFVACDKTAASPATNRLQKLRRIVAPIQTKDKKTVGRTADAVPTKEFLAEYERLHLEHVGERPMVGAKEGDLAAKVVRKYGPAKAAELLAYFYTHRPRWARERNRYDVAAFFHSIPELLGMRRDGV